VWWINRHRGTLFVSKLPTIPPHFPELSAQTLSADIHSESLKPLPQE
jgi:hypothetical protein